MTPQQRQAHERLLRILPSRKLGEFLNVPDWVVRRAKANEVAVVVFGRRYESIKAAALATGYTRGRIWQLVNSRERRCRYAK